MENRELTDDEFFSLSLEEQHQYLEQRVRENFILSKPCQIIPGPILNEKGEICAAIYDLEGNLTLRPLTPLGSEYADEFEAADAHLASCVVSSEGQSFDEEEDEQAVQEESTKSAPPSQLKDIKGFEEEKVQNDPVQENLTQMGFIEKGLSR